ncbi:SDR family NAD(P)-dependent oxidoreductase, partial [bacterium]|nr:SDR family NAD(P)-dependent oxidoreductase [bacterium]
DVRQREEMDTTVREFYSEVGRLDVGWVNSGISLDSSYTCWDWQNFEALIDTNLKGAIYTTQACLQFMVPNGAGTIVGIGSSAAMRGLPSRGIYCLTKVSLEYYFQSLMAELPNIQFTLVHPGFVDTPINQNNPNRFWLLTPEKAAQIMVRAVAKRRRMLVYPFKMNLLFRFVRSLPLPIFTWMAHRTMNLSRPQASPQVGVPSATTK